MELRELRRRVKQLEMEQEIPRGGYRLAGILAVGLLALAPLVACTETDTREGTAAPWEVAVSTPEFSFSDEHVPGGFYPVTGVLSFSDVIIFASRQRLFRLRPEDAEVLTVTGGAGRGPGEFNGISLIGRAPGGEIFAWDRAQQRLSFLDDMLSFQRSIPTAEWLGMGIVRCVAADDSVVTTYSQKPIPARATSGLTSIELEVAMGGPGPGPGLVLGRLPGLVQWTAVVEGEGIRRSFVLSVPYSPVPIVRCETDPMGKLGAVYWGNGADPVVSWWKGDGEIGETVLQGIETLQFDERDRQQLIDSIDGPELMEFSAINLAALEAYAPERLPYYEDFFVDQTTGELWAQHPRRSAAGDRLWSVHAPDGGLLRRIAVPLAFTITDVHAGLAVGYFARPDGLHEIRAYR